MNIFKQQATSSNRIQEQYMLYKQEHQGDIDRLKSICFPKTPKTNTNSSSVSGSAGKPPQPLQNYLQVRQCPNNSQIYSTSQTQMGISQMQSPPRQSNSLVKRKALNKSVDSDSGCAFFGTGKENEYIQQNDSHYRYATSKSNILTTQSTTGEAPNTILEEYTGLRRRSFKNQISQIPNTNIERTISFEIEDHFEPTTRSYIFEETPLSKNPNLSIDQSNLMKEMSSFVKKIGKELNDLCLTKTSEKILQQMIEKHLSEIANMKQQFQTVVKKNEANVTVSLQILGKCFQELIEKLGDLINRLRMFNRKKFKNLIESSLSNTLNEVFEESNKLNLLETITNINVFLNQQRKNFGLYKLASLIVSKINSQKRYSLFMIADTSRQKIQSIIIQSSRVETQLSKVLSIVTQKEKQIVSQMFFKWQYQKRLVNCVNGRVISGLSRIDVLFSRKQRIESGDFLLALKENMHFERKKTDMFLRCQNLIHEKQRILVIEGFWKMKSLLEKKKLLKGSLLIKTKTKLAIKILQSIQENHLSQAFRNLKKQSEYLNRMNKGVIQIKNIVEKRKKNFIISIILDYKLSRSLASFKEQNCIPKGLHVIKSLFQSQQRVGFTSIKNFSFIKPLPTQEIFQTIGDALEKVEIPTLRNILRTIDTCLSNKKITRYLSSLKQIEFKLVNFSQKRIISLNPIWKKLEDSEIEPDFIYKAQSVINKSDSFQQGFEVIQAKLSSAGSSIREGKFIYSTVLLQLEYQADPTLCKGQDLACETVCSSQMGKIVEETIVKLSRTIKNRLRESFYRERLHLKICQNIRENHERRNASLYLQIWRNGIHERLITENNHTQEKVLLKQKNERKLTFLQFKVTDLEKQLLAYKVELEKKKMHSSNIMKELGAKREEVIEIEAVNQYYFKLLKRLEDLTIEKKAKSKCLATALFANFLESRLTRFQQIKRSFSIWIEAISQKRIAAVACEQIEDIHSKHVEMRFQSAMYLLKHFQESYRNRLKTYTLKILAYNSVCSNNSQLNFSQLNNNSNILRSPTPSSLSPNVSLARHKKMPSSHSQNNLNGFTLQQQDTNQSPSPISSRRIEIQNSLLNKQTLATAGFESPQHSPLNLHLSSSMMMEHDGNKNKQFFSSANATNNTRINQSLISTYNNNSNNNNQLNQHDLQLGQRQQFMPFNQNENNLISVQTDDSNQPPVQLQPTNIMNPHLSTNPHVIGRTTNTSSVTSLPNTTVHQQQQLQSPYQNQQGSYSQYSSQPQQNYMPQQFFSTQQKKNNRAQAVQEQHSLISQHPLTDSKINGKPTNLNTSYQNYYRPPMANSDFEGMGNSQNGSTNTTQRGSGNNKSFGNHSSANQTRDGQKQPSNLGYRLSAKTINFLQKFGRDGQNGNAMGNSFSSSASQRNTSQRNRSSNQ